MKNAGAKRNASAIQISASSGGCVLLSGTPIQNRTSEPAVLLHVLDPRAYQQIKNTERIEIPRIKGMLAPLMLRRRKDDVLSELPPVIEQVVPLEGNIYKVVGLRAEDEVPLRDGSGERNRITALHALKMAGESVLRENPDKRGDLAWREWSDEYYVLRAALSIGPEKDKASPHNPSLTPALGLFEKIRNSLAKLKASDPKVLDLVTDVIDEKGSVVLFTAHHDASDVLSGTLKSAGYGVEIIDGRLRPERRGTVVERFQQGEIQCLIAGMDAAGEGLTLTRADTAIFLEMAYKPATLRQARDRLHRIGQASSVVQAIYLVADNPIDRFFRDLCLDKAALTSAVLGEDVRVLAESVHLDAPRVADSDSETVVVVTEQAKVLPPQPMQAGAADLSKPALKKKANAARLHEEEPSPPPALAASIEKPATVEEAAADDATSKRTPPVMPHQDQLVRKREQVRVRAQRYREKHPDEHRAYMRNLMRKIRTQNAGRREAGGYSS